MSYAARYQPYNANNKSKKEDKTIYADQDIYTGKTESGYYLYHTTADPMEKFKQRRIGTLSERPEKKYIEEQQRYGPNNDKIKWKMDKEAVREWIEESYGFIFSDKPSPWAPKKLGEPSVKHTTGYEEDDEEMPSPSDPPAKDKKKDLYLSILDAHTILLNEISTSLRELSARSSSSNSISQLSDQVS